MRRVFIALALSLSLPAFAGDLREPVLAALSGIEDVPSADDLRSLGEGVDAELLEIAQDTSLSHTRRARAVHALGWFPTAANQAALTQTLAGEDDLLARKAAYALANGWSDGAIVVLEPALAADSVQLRMATARALGNIGTEPAKVVLNARLAVETNASVQDTIRQTLAD